MKAIIAIGALLIGCGAAEKSIDQDVSIPVQDPAELVGNWCNDDLCLKVSSTSYGPNWLVYTWKSPECQEGGFIQVDSSGQLLFGAFDFNHTGCFSKLSEDRYVGAFSMRGNDLEARLSVTGQTLILKSQ